MDVVGSHTFSTLAIKDMTACEPFAAAAALCNLNICLYVIKASDTTPQIIIIVRKWHGD